MNRNEINALPLAGDVSFRERAVEPGRTALLLIDLQNGEYNEKLVKAEPENAYFWNRLGKTVIPNGQKLIAACRGAGSRCCGDACRHREALNRVHACLSIAPASGAGRQIVPGLRPGDSRKTAAAAWHAGCADGTGCKLPQRS